jgi:hypothetical protein
MKRCMIRKLVFITFLIVWLVMFILACGFPVVPFHVLAILIAWLLHRANELVWVLGGQDAEKQ